MILTHRHSVQVTFPVISFDSLQSSFDLTDPSLSLGLHVQDSGEFTDIDLIEKFIAVFKALGVDKFDQKSHIHCQEEEKVLLKYISYHYFNC